MINVTKTYLPDKSKLQGYFDQIHASGWLTNNGKLLLELEDKLRQVLQAEYLVLVVNGTCALQLAYKVLELKGEVITTPFTFVATASSLVWEGLTPVFADIDPENLNMDPGQIEDKITANTSAIVPVHVFGNSCKVEAIDAIARKHQLKVIYDAAHAFSVLYKGKGISQFGDVSVYSFHSTKIYHTIEGGALVFKSKDLYEKALLMRNFGIPGYDQISEIGVNFKMNEYQAAMGLAVLDDFPEVNEKRKQVYLNYENAFRNHPVLKLQSLDPDASRNYAYFPVIFRSEEQLLNVKRTFNEHQIYPRRYFYPSLNELPYLKIKQPMPVSESISRRILCLPLFHDLDPKDQQYIIETINSLV